MKKANLALEAGETASKVDLGLTRHAVISGRVVDEDGEPLAWVQSEREARDKS